MSQALAKLDGDLAAIRPHLTLEADADAVANACTEVAEALDRLTAGGFLIEATRLVAHALPKREAVSWRVKPRYNAEVNGWWISDDTRYSYKVIAEEKRLTKPRKVGLLKLEAPEIEYWELDEYARILAAAREQISQLQRQVDTAEEHPNYEHRYIG